MVRGEVSGLWAGRPSPAASPVCAGDLGLSQGPHHGPSRLCQARHTGAHIQIMASSQLCEYSRLEYSGGNTAFLYKLVEMQGSLAV